MEIMIIKLFFLSLIISLALWHFGSHYGKKALAREQEYEKLYREIQDDLKRPTNDHLKAIINYKLHKLHLMKHKNEEKYHVVAVEFLRKFYECSV